MFCWGVTGAFPSLLSKCRSMWLGFFWGFESALHRIEVPILWSGARTVLLSSLLSLRFSL